MKGVPREVFPKDRQAGFSLVELMIAMALGLAVVLAVGTLSVNATRSYRAVNRSGELFENGRYAIRILKDDLEHAGFFGHYFPPAKQATGLANPCEKSPSNLALGIDAPVGLPQTVDCLNDRELSTGILVTYRADTNLAGSIDEENSYIQTNASDYIIGNKCKLENGTVTCEATASSLPTAPKSLKLTKPDVTLAGIRKIHSNIYYIRKYSKSSSDGIQTLMRKSPTDIDSNAQVLIEGIENLQLQYGIDNDQNGSPDTYSTAPAAVVDWSNVVAIRVNLLARSLEPDPSYQDTQSYDLGGVTIAAKNDYYRRRVFSQVVRLINISGRRER